MSLKVACCDVLERIAERLGVELDPRSSVDIGISAAGQGRCECVKKQGRALNRGSAFPGFADPAPGAVRRRGTARRRASPRHAIRTP
ncbi:MAG TPA: hypothetical protein VFJ82_03500 [Longimicrobium sp.]|nr:hypothetical protein [Longimicrobium sp.]